MMHYQKITFLTNKHRQKILATFRTNVIDFFEQTKLPKDSQREEYRAKINRLLLQAHNAVIKAGITPVVSSCNSMLEVDLIVDIFELQGPPLYITPQKVIDLIDRVASVYETDYFFSVVRTFNPFFYLSHLMQWISELPFRFLSRLGFDASHAEYSVVGKIFKGLVQLASLLGSGAVLHKYIYWFFHR